MALKAIAAVVVNYGTADHVLAALPALLDELEPIPRRLIVIVDNASPNGDGERLAAHFVAHPDDRVHLIRSLCNGGFAAGNNLALAELEAIGWEADAVLLINPDSLVRPGAIGELARVMAEHPRAGVVGARLENPDGSTWNPAFVFPSAMGEFALGARLSVFLRRWPPSRLSDGRPLKVDWVTGAAMLIRAETLREVGPLDEGFFLYYEEVDFMRRAAERGWEMWYAPGAVVLHESGAATGFTGGLPKSGVPDYWFRSWRRYFVKSHGPAYARIAAVMKLLGLAVGAAQLRLRGRNPDLPKGFWNAFFRKGLLGDMSVDSPLERP